MTKAWIPVVILLGMALTFGGLWAYGSATGTKPVQSFCQSVTDTSCSNVPLEGIAYEAVGGGTFVATTGTPATTPSTPTQQVIQPSSVVNLAVKDFSLKVKEPYSLSWTAYSGTLRIFDANDNLVDPNIAAIDTASVTSGAASKTSWNVFRTDIPYKAVLDGGGTYYDTLLNPFVFKSSDYNKALGSYSLVLGDQGSTDTRLSSKAFPDVYVGEKIGTWSVTFSSCASLQCGNTTLALNYSDSGAAGQGSVDIKFSNSGANTLIKDAVIAPVSDQTNALEGNEITTATIQHVSGTDFGLPSTVTSYLTNEIPIKLGNIKGGQSSTDTWTFTVNEDNTAASEALHLYFDDLNGYRNSDHMVGNLGIAATDIPLTFIA